VTRKGSLDLPRTDTEFRAERLGMALSGLAAELVAERQKVAELRREIAGLRAQLASLAPAVGDEVS
jgi:hypothetical protein